MNVEVTVDASYSLPICHTLFSTLSYRVRCLSFRLQEHHHFILFQYVQAKLLFPPSYPLSVCLCFFLVSLLDRSSACHILRVEDTPKTDGPQAQADVQYLSGDIVRLPHHPSHIIPVHSWPARISLVSPETASGRGSERSAPGEG